MKTLYTRPGAQVSVDEFDGKRVFRTTSDVTSTLERAKAMSNEGYDTVQRGAMAGAKFVGEYDITVVDAWARRRGLTYADVMADDKLLLQMVRDPELAHFRVYQGRV